MADNMCGPSTALKSFSEHVNQDRSLHQDRATPGSRNAGPAGFRSTPAGPRTDAEFQAFAGGAGPALQPVHMPMNPEPFHPMTQHPQMRYASPAIPAGVPMAAPGPVPFQHLHQGMTASHGAQAGNAWASEFASMQGAASQVPGAPTTSIATPPFVHAAHPMQQQAPLGYTPMMPNYTTPFMPQQTAFQRMTSAAVVTEAAGPVSGSGVAGLSEADLEARFAAFEADIEFEKEMDSWMAEHGPTAEERGAAGNQTEDVNAILENIAEELEAQKLADGSATNVANLGAAAQSVAPESLSSQQPASLEQQLAADQAIPEESQQEMQPLPEEAAQEAETQKEQLAQDDLARTAEQIVHTLDAHPSDRFRSSAFVGLMRRIKEREVMVRDNVLFDATTGQPLEPADGTSEIAENTESSTMPPSARPFVYEQPPNSHRAVA